LNSIWRFWYVVNHKWIISDYINKDFDWIVFVWWTWSLIFWDNIELKDLTKRYLDTNKLVASICASSRNLIKWWLVDWREITWHNWDNNFKKIAEDAWAKTHLENVAVSWNLITWYWPEAVEEFSNAIIKYLNK
jgi:putative intracellular protease/amidase